MLVDIKKAEVSSVKHLVSPRLELMSGIRS